MSAGENLVRVFGTKCGGDCTFLTEARKCLGHVDFSFFSKKLRSDHLIKPRRRQTEFLRSLCEIRYDSLK